MFITSNPVTRELFGVLVRDGVNEDSDLVAYSRLDMVFKGGEEVGYDSLKAPNRSGKYRLWTVAWKDRNYLSHYEWEQVG